MIDLTAIQQQLMQPETPFDRAMADPLFNIGIALMSSPNIGAALQQGLKATQSIKANRLQNQIRLAQLQMQMQPKADTPTALMRHMAIAQDPNNPLSQMMQKYLFKPTGSNVTVNMPGQVAQGMEKIPGYVAPGPTEGSYYRQVPGQDMDIGYLPGAVKPTDSQLKAGIKSASMSVLNDAMKSYENAGMNDAALITSRAGASAGAVGGYIARSVSGSLDPKVEEYNVMGDRYVSNVVRTESGAQVPEQEHNRYTNLLSQQAGDSLGKVKRKQYLRDQIDAEMARQGRSTLTTEAVDAIISNAPSVEAFEYNSNITPEAVPKAQPSVGAGGGATTGSSLLDRALGIQ